jgi:hypothetical protein
MTPRLMGRLLKVGAFLTASLVLSGAAQDREAEAPSDATLVGTNTNLGSPAKSATIAQKAPEQKQLSKSLPSKAIREILKMVDAGVSKEVIKAYVETAPIAYDPSAADIIALKQKGIPDDVTMALLKRSTEVRLQNPQAAADQPAPASVVSRENHFYPGPEGYDYFQYYYLYPRTLASANERLGRYPAPYFSGYYGAFGPYSPRGLYFGNRRGLYAP